jgi:nitrile hydratase accessory protein
VTASIDKLAELTGSAALPRRNGELVFEAPWQGRALGMALGVVERLDIPWREFQQRLIAEIAARPDAAYYDCWVGALERLVLDHRVASRDELEAARRRASDAADAG